MGINKTIKTIYDKIVIGTIKNTEVTPKVEKWDEYLEKIGWDDNPLNESYRKHLCRMTYFSLPKKIVINFLSVLYLLFSPYKVKENMTLDDDLQNNNALLIERKEIPSSDIFPSILNESYEKVHMLYYDDTNKRILSKELRGLYLSIKKKYYFHPYYLLQVKQGLAMLSNCLAYKPFDALVVYDSERDVSSPIITDYLEKKGKKYISFMHGEYLLQILQAHMSFSEYYIWNPIYADMFGNRLRCNIHVFTNYVPKKLQKKWDLKEEPDHFLTYYLSGESTTTLKSLVPVFNKLENRGRVCKVRPHPRYSHLDLLNQLFDMDNIEDPRQTNIKDSLASTEYVVGLSTTVLSEAYAEGKEIIIDDVTDPPEYENLKKRYCISLQLPHKLLSDVISEIQE